MIFLKRYVVIFSSLILILSFCITAFSFKIDGFDYDVEWEDSDSVALFIKEESNSKINFGSYKWVIEDGSLFICFNFYEKDFDHLNSNIGISFSIEDSQYYTLESESSDVFDSDKYRVETAMMYDGAYGAVCEARVGFKYGIPDQINGKVRFIDTYGSYSNVYHFTINLYSNDYTYYSPEVPVEKTTKPTASNTTKQTTKSKNTTKKVTTTESNGSIWDLLDILLETSTTKPEKTTKPKAEKKSKVNVVTSVFVVEKEITYNITEAVTEIYNKTSLTNENIINSTVSTSDGKKYQMLTAIAGGITLITVAILGTYGANKKTNNKSSDLKEDNE